MPPSTDFAVLARKMAAPANRRLSQSVKLFKQNAPEIAEQIRKDGERRGPLSFWGRSRNVDELADAVIVDPAVLEVMAHISGQKFTALTPHAGLQHTYGYLFSTIETPYGFKRDRWVETEIENAFALDPSTLGPNPKQGTLLANATWFAGSCAFRGRSQPRSRLQNFLGEKVSPDLLSLRPRKGCHLRLSERVSNTWRGSRRSWTLQTDLLASPKDPRFNVLIYSVIDHYHDSHQLITLFPIGAASSLELRARGNTKRHNDIRSRYNAYVPALDDQVMSGTVRLREF